MGSHPVNRGATLTQNSNKMPDEIVYNRDWAVSYLKSLKLQDLIVEDFVQAVCEAPKESAAFILAWVERDLIGTAEVIGYFFGRVFKELRVHSSYLEPAAPNPPLRNRFRPSFSNFSFEEFCALLRKNRDLVELFRRSEFYPLNSPDDLWFFGDDVTRRIIREEKLEKEHKKAETERIAREDHRREKKLKKALEGSERATLRSAESTDRRREREAFAALPIADQFAQLIQQDDRPIKSFAFDPDSVTNQLLEQYEREVLENLLSRISGQRTIAWKRLGERIKEALRRQD